MHLKIITIKKKRKENEDLSTALGGKKGSWKEQKELKTSSGIVVHVDDYVMIQLEVERNGEVINIPTPCQVLGLYFSSNKKQKIITIQWCQSLQEYRREHKIFSCPKKSEKKWILTTHTQEIDVDSVIQVLSYRPFDYFLDLEDNTLVQL